MVTKLGLCALMVIGLTLAVPLAAGAQTCGLGVCSPPIGRPSSGGGGGGGGGSGGGDNGASAAAAAVTKAELLRQAVAAFTKGTQTYQAGDFAGTITWFQKALVTDPDNDKYTRALVAVELDEHYQDLLNAAEDSLAQYRERGIPVRVQLDADGRGTVRLEFDSAEAAVQ